MNTSSGKNTRSVSSVIGGVLLVSLVATAYIPAMKAGFVWDDDLHITDNMLLRTNDGLKKIWFEPSAWPYHYWPLVLTSWWIQYQIWGLDLMGYHVTNIILHGLSAVLLWLILQKLKIPRPWLVSCLFALHPVHVESVAWASEHKNILSGFFYLLSLLAYLSLLFENKSRQICNSYSGNNAIDQFNSIKNFAIYLLSLLLFSLALLSKTVTCSLPAVILLILWWKRNKLTWNNLYPLMPFFILGFILGMSTVFTEMNKVGSTGELHWIPTFYERILIAGRSLWFYIAKLIWPSNLAFIYPKWNIDTHSLWQHLFPFGFISVLAVLWMSREKIGKGPLVAMLIFSGTLFPALGFINIYTMRYSYVADHFQYLASISLITLFSVGLTRFLDKYDRKKAIPATLSVYGIILICFWVTVWNETYKFKDLETLWRDTIVKHHDVALAHLNLSVILNQKGEYDDAIHHATMAIQINPNLYESYNSVGNALTKKKRYQEAINYYAKAIQIADAEKVNTAMYFHFNMGNALVEMGRLDEAIDHFNKAIKINPDYLKAHSNLGNALLKKKNYHEAIFHFREAIRINPHLHYPYANLGVALFMTGHKDAAIRNLKEALKIKPDYTMAIKNLYIIQQSQTKPNDWVCDKNMGCNSKCWLSI